MWGAMKMTVAVMLLLCSYCFAATPDWQDATVTNLTTEDNGASVIVMPMGNGAVGRETPHTRSFYWIKAEKITYVIPTHYQGSSAKSLVSWNPNTKLLLTIGGPVKIYVRKGELHMLDGDKDRKFKIISQVAN